MTRRAAQAGQGGLSPVQIKPRSVKYLGWRPDVPDHRDKVMNVQAKSYPPKSGLNIYQLPPIRDQGEQGSCTGHSTRTAAQFVRAFMGQDDAALELSPRFSYYNGRKLEGTTKEDAGAEIRDVIKGIAKMGIASEKVCKYNPRSFRTAPSKAAYKEALTDTFNDYMRAPQTLDMMRGCLHAQFPIVFGFSCYDSMDDPQVAKDGLLPMPSGGNQGGHAVCAVGYDDNKMVCGEKGGVLIANSWGTDWGCEHPDGPGLGRGYFWMSYKFWCDANLCDDGWTVRKMS